MDVWILRSVAGRLILVGGGLLPSAALADSDVFVTPSLSAAEIYDDNLFFSPSQREQDRVLRLSPAIEAGVRSAPLTVRGRYTFDAEHYARHPDLDSSQARKQAALDLRYRPTRVLTLAADVSYVRTQTPGELNLETGVERERLRAERYSLSPAAAYRFDRLTVGTTTYTFTRDRLVGGIGSDTHAVALGLDRRLTRQDTATFGYTLRQYRFEGQDAVTSHSLLVGDTHEFTPRTSATVTGGPRFSDGSTDLEISASLRHTLDRGGLTLTYTRSPTTVIGQSGVATTQSLGGTLAYRPEPYVEIRAAPSVLSSTRGDLEAKVFRVNLDASYRISRYLSLIGSYQFSAQHGSLDAPGSADVTRKSFMLGIVVAPPTRSDSALPTRPRTPSTLGAESDVRRTELRPVEE